jgi:hypothetical protein
VVSKNWVWEPTSKKIREGLVVVAASEVNFDVLERGEAGGLMLTHESNMSRKLMLEAIKIKLSDYQIR